MSTSFSVWQGTGLGLLALVLFAYGRLFFRGSAVPLFADLLFLTAFAAAVASLAFPLVFDRLAHEIVGHTPLPSALAEGDAQVAALVAMPGEMIDAALARIGFDGEEDEPIESAMESEPDSGVALKTGAPGAIEARVRPAVEAVLALPLRVGTGVSSGFGLLLALALRRIAVGRDRLRDLAERLERVEARFSGPTVDPDDAPDVGSTHT